MYKRQAHPAPLDPPWNPLTFHPSSSPVSAPRFYLCTFLTGPCLCKTKGYPLEVGHLSHSPAEKEISSFCLLSLFLHLHTWMGTGKTYSFPLIQTVPTHTHLFSLTHTLEQGWQTHFHQAPHQPRSCLQRAEIILGLYKCNYSLTVKELKLHSALWRQLRGWCGPQWKWVWYSCYRLKIWGPEALLATQGHIPRQYQCQMKKIF